MGWRRFASLDFDYYGIGFLSDRFRGTDISRGVAGAAVVSTPKRKREQADDGSSRKQRDRPWLGTMQRGPSSPVIVANPVTSAPDSSKKQYNHNL